MTISAAVRLPFARRWTTPAQHRVALRAGLAVLVALTATWQLDRLNWAAYAMFGAFPTVYGGPLRWSGRVRLHVAMGLLLTGAVTDAAAVGTFDNRRWVAIPVVASWAVLAAALSDRFRWRPPGPLIPVFAVATAAAVPASGTDVIAAPLVCGATAAFAILLGVVEHTVFPLRDPRPAPPFPLPDRRRQQLHAVRCGVAVAVAGTITTSLGIGRPYWSMVAAVVPLGIPGLRAQLRRGLHRAGGTLLGLALAAVLLELRLPTPAVVVCLALLQVLTELVVVANYLAGLVFITPMALLLVHLSVPGSIGPLLADRLAETLIGLGVGLLTAVLTRRRDVPGPGESAS
ncbi:MAG TPA: FUSC family protein [Sporichthyaceae bacterium]|jgi:hypothetical protein